MAEPLHLKAYQEAAIERAIRQDRLAVLADPGLGKTVISLETFRRLRSWCDVSSALVVAPLRVCFSVWPREVARWDRFEGLRIQVLHGPTRTPEHLRGADVYVINSDLEALRWLARQRWEWPELLIVDESTRFKRKSSQRSGVLRKMLPRFQRRLLLTGTPAPNGLENLHGQAYLLDGGTALFADVGDFRARWMVPVPTPAGYVRWVLRSGAAEEIHARMAPLCIRLDAADHLDLPELVQVRVPVELPADARALYRRLEDDLVAQVGPGWVEAPNAGTLSLKLRQVTGGAVYLTPDGGVSARETRRSELIHRAKAEALAALVEELQGQPLLIAYAFEHELALIRDALAPLQVPAINGQTSGREGARIERAWNAGELAAMAIQPQSGALGLNLQDGGHHLCWYADTWDLELHDQLIRRLLRQGQRAAHVLAYYLTAEGTVDERMAQRRAQKDQEQRGFLDAVRGSPRPGG